MKNFGLFGEKLSHSKSPEIQKYIYSKIGYNAEYSLVEFNKSEIEQKISLLREGIFDGVNVTIPYKKDIMKYLDYMDQEAESIGAVNTIVPNKGILKGYNTDYYGIEKTLEPYGVIKGGTYLILGYGGASRPLIEYLVNQEAKSIFIASRTPENYRNFIKNTTKVSFINYDEIGKIKGEIIINTTPVGMYPNIENSPVDKSIFENFNCAVDFIYNPCLTKFLEEAGRAGIKTQNGLKMLVYQAIKSVELWSGVNIDSEIQLDIYLHFWKKNKKCENIYLVGLPGSGKTTVGKILSKFLGYRHIDLDDYIVKKYNLSIEEIFEKYGEEGFRDRETVALKEVSVLANVVVSTGGGIVTLSENREIIKEKDIVIFVDRSCKEIVRDVNLMDRPILKKFPDRIYELRNERLKFYKEVSNYIVKNDSTMEKLMSDIFSCL